MRDVSRIKLGGLDAYDVPGSADGKVIVLLHGFGADANDLLGLHRHIATPPGTRWVVPDAPHRLAMSPLLGGRAWFPIDQQAVQLAVAVGTHRDLSKVTPDGLMEAREAIFRLLADIGRPLTDIVLAGFSQGAMVATEVALSLPVNVAGLVLFSSTLLHADLWRGLARQHAGLAFFQSHGRFDPLLSIEAARRLRAVLNEAGMPGELHEFSGQHEIPGPVLNAAQTFLRELLSPNAQGPA